MENFRFKVNTKPTALIDEDILDIEYAAEPLDNNTVKVSWVYDDGDEQHCFYDNQDVQKYIDDKTWVIL